MGVQKVVERCEVAKENGGIMDLSGCHLFHDEGHTINCLQSLIKCYHQNSTQIPKQFNFITELNLSHNRMSTLPEEISKCTQLETVDISNNSFVNLPNCLFNLPKIIKIIARKNFIAEVDIDLLTTCDGSSTLETLNLEENPLSRDCQDNLGTINSIRISITPREIEEWEDLSI